MTQPGRHSDYRFERKFLTDQLGFCALENLVQMHPSCFSEIYFRRQVNNIYFDTPDLRFFEDNVSGSADRLKVRIRWYGKNGCAIQKPVLELKKKKGWVGMKSSYLLNDFDLDETLPPEFFRELFEASDLPGDLVQVLIGLEPVLQNGYQRNYYASFDKKFRFTIDQALSFIDFQAKSRGVPVQFDEVQTSILELKYDQPYDHEAIQVIGNLPIRITKSSKYVSGVYKIRPDLAV